MRILFVSLIEAYWGGSEVLWHQAALAAGKRGWTVGAFFPYYRDLPQTQALAAAGVNLYFGTPPPKRWWKRMPGPRLDRLKRFQAALDECRPDIVVITQGAVTDGDLEIVQCKKRLQPYAILNQCVEPLTYRDDIWRKLREKYLGAYVIWCVSQENLDALRDYLSLPLAQASAISNAYGCAFDVESPWPEDTIKRLAVVGRLDTRQKGQDLLLEALAHTTWRQRPVEVTFFGEGPDRDQLEARRARLGLDFVHIPGRSASVGDIWLTHHALLQPSRFEGQSLSMIEAMLHRRPVICTPVGGTAGVVIEGETGFLGDAVESVPSLQRLLERAWSGRTHWRQIGSQARDHVRTIVASDPGADFLARIEVASGSPPPASP